MRNYGTATHNKKKKTWIIHTEPHVALKLKRLFTQIDSSQVDQITISANPTNSYDLRWFFERYPHQVDPQDLLEKLALDFEEKQTTLELLLQGTSTLPPTTFNLKRPARDYQLVAADMWRTMGGLLLGDAVGVGKTVSTLAGLMDSRTLPALIVVQAHLPDQWIEKINEFTDFSVHKLKKSTPYDITKYHDGKFPDVIVSSYHKMSGWAQTIAKVVQSVTFDEVQELRHTGTAKYNAAKYIASEVPFRLGLSATPIFNFGDEIWNIINILSQDSLGTFEEFRREWCSVAYSDKLRVKNPQALGLHLREQGLMLRRTRKEIGRELPPVITVPHHIEADPKEFNKIQSEAIDLAKLILRQKQDFKGQKMQAAGEFDMRMRMATGVAKAPMVADFVKMLCEDNNIKVVLFGWHRSVYDIWLERLKDLKPVLYTGTESAAQKEASKKAFIQGDSQVMIISLRSGAGLDGLQDVCSTAVFGELDWSPAVHTQCIGRLSRDRSDTEIPESVLAYFLITNHGSDPIMVDIAGIKQSQSSGIVDPKQELVTPVEVDPSHVRRLAENYLSQHGIEIPKEEEISSIEPTGETNVNVS